jgi:hypothetical protein
MENLFKEADASRIIQRIEKLNPGSKAVWGKMNVSQMLAHCGTAMETVTGQRKIKRVAFFGRIIGTLLKPGILSEKPFSKSSPTDKSYIISGDVNFAEEKAKLTSLIKQFSAGGPSKCTPHPHAFFGKFTPEQWARFEWKHLDHHLRQFGV